MKIAMIGTGYVGLVSGICLSDFGHDVVCVDKDASKVEMLQRGEVPIYELGLDQLMEKNVSAGRLSFTTNLPEALDGADAVFIAVGTPTRRGDGHADLSFVMAAAEEIAKTAKNYIGSPAHAGIDPIRALLQVRRPRFPRTRGDRPPRSIPATDGPRVPPHTRG